LSVTTVESAGGVGCALIRLLALSPTSGANAETYPSATTLGSYQYNANSGIEHE
jgi:hypothetical protein